MISGKPVPEPYSSSRALGSQGEFGTIASLARLLGKRPDCAVSVGDDAAVLEGREGYFTLFTTDMAVEGVHFPALEMFPAAREGEEIPGQRRQPDRTAQIRSVEYMLGRKLMAGNISDIAAMGGYPTHAVVSVAAPATLTLGWLEELYRGMADEAGGWGADIVGGDTVSSERIAVNIALLGEVETERVVLRRGASPGEYLYVTGTLGDSAAGLEILLNELEGWEGRLGGETSEEATLVERHLQPMPRVPAGREFSKGVASAMIDLSDGLAGDIRHICRAGKVGAVVRQPCIPISKELLAYCTLRSKDPLHFALRGGEDYELLFSSSAKDLDGQFVGGVRITQIGEVTPAAGEVVLEDRSGARSTLEVSGYEHFRTGGL